MHLTFSILPLQSDLQGLSIEDGQVFKVRLSFKLFGFDFNFIFSINYTNDVVELAELLLIHIRESARAPRALVFFVGSWLVFEMPNESIRLN